MCGAFHFNIKVINLRRFQALFATKFGMPVEKTGSGLLEATVKKKQVVGSV